MSLKTSSENSSFLKGLFREYYFKDSTSLVTPSMIEKREFGYMSFDSIMVRHLSFRNKRELIARLVQESPSDVYCSNGYYKFPTNSVQSKEWEGADLIFDIDLKDLNMPCSSEHSFYVCDQCGTCNVSFLNACTVCLGRKISRTTIPCRKCLISLKKETQRLFEFLHGDLGIADGSIETFFSGNAGYHIHVSDSEFKTLDSRARSDLVDYICGNGIMNESIGVRKSKNGFYIKFPKSGMVFGWRRRVASEFGINQSSISKLKRIVESSGGYGQFKEDLSTKAKLIGVRIDPHVTTDIHRIFRMPGTINGKSSLLKVKSTNLETFNPLDSACVLDDRQVYIRSKVNLKLYLHENYFRIKNSIERLPAYAAAYMICKGLADFIK
ncbi:MAG: DNA primase small subunit domain-containing protein [Nitrososphaeraceae archaeon]